MVCFGNHCWYTIDAAEDPLGGGKAIVCVNTHSQRTLGRLPALWLHTLTIWNDACIRNDQMVTRRPVYTPNTYTNAHLRWGHSLKQTSIWKSERQGLLVSVSKPLIHIYKQLQPNTAVYTGLKKQKIQKFNSLDGTGSWASSHHKSLINISSSYQVFYSNPG